MRAIIIAAGRGKRMGALSSALPKCLLQVNGKTILSRQICVFKACGIKDIVIIKGYRKELINYNDGVRYYINKEYRKNNILNSLFVAEKEIVGDVVISYGDILFTEAIVKKLIHSRASLAVVADTDWKLKYSTRLLHPIAEAEKIVMSSQKKLTAIGKILKTDASANAEFPGMMKVNASGARTLRDTFAKVKKIFLRKPFQTAKTFQQAYLTDMLQELVERGKEVACVCIKGGWQEIDTPEDYESAKENYR